MVPAATMCDDRVAIVEMVGWGWEPAGCDDASHSTLSQPSLLYRSRHGRPSDYIESGADSE